MESDPFSGLDQLRAHPGGRALMRQSWHSLTFFHRKFTPKQIQPLLPPGLTVHTFHGDAFIGLVPFVMRQVRINGLPPLPNHRTVVETNVRTYVTDSRGRPGVYFFSLDCGDLLAIRTARMLFGLNYLPAKLAQSGTADRTVYSGTRSQTATYHAEVHHAGEPKPAIPGTLEYWLVERYMLFAQRGKTLLSGQVNHPPYPLLSPARYECRESMISATTGLPQASDWDSVLYSPGVDVEIFYPLRCG